MNPIAKIFSHNKRVWLGLLTTLITVGLLAGAVVWLVDSPPQTPTEDQPPQALRGIHYTPPRSAPELSGVDHNAKAYTLARQPHPLAMVFFGYISCTDVCPTNLKKFEKIQEILGDDADQIQFVFVSIDPQKERPETMKHYLKNYDGEIIGVTSLEANGLDQAYQEWGIVRKRVELDEPVGDQTYKFDHSGQIFLVQDGQRIPVSYPYGTSLETMAEDLRALLDDPDLGERLPQVGTVREVVIEPGSYTRAAQNNPTLPAYLRLHVGDTIRWRNEDYMYHFVGDLSMAPGQEAVQKFDEAGEFYFGCTAVPNEVIRVVVKPDRHEG